MLIKNIILVGKCSINPNRYTYPSSFYRTLKELGYNVTLVNYDLSSNLRLFHFVPTLLKNFIYTKLINYQLKKTATTSHPDLILCIKADLITPTTLRFIKERSPQTKLALFYPDNPFTFWNGNSNANILNALPIYDYFLIWSKLLMPVLQSAGAKNVRYFPFAFDEVIFNQPITISNKEKQKYTCEICFIGTWDPDREWWLTELIIQMPTLKLAIWGNRWAETLPLSSPLHKYLRGKAIYMAEMVKAFACSKITLNFVRQQNMTSHNMRTFEALASNVFMLTQRTTEQTTTPFIEGDNIECFATPDELMKKIAFYLDHDTIRKSIAKKGQQLAQHFMLRKQLQTLVQDIGDDKSE